MDGYDKLAQLTIIMLLFTLTNTLGDIRTILENKLYLN